MPANIDEFLTFRISANDNAGRSGRSAGATSAFPVLIRVRDGAEKWDPGVPGITIQSRIGRIISASITAEALKKIADDENVIAIEASAPPSVSDCVKTIPWVEADVVHTSPGPFQERGQHAIAAFIDDGFDVMHLAFRTPLKTPIDPNTPIELKTRIIALWDQRTTTPSLSPKERMPGVYSQCYGTLHLRDDIDRYLRTGKPEHELGRDTEPGIGGHGTHVASIAAGSPFENEREKFPGGIAPDAKIVVVIVTRHYRNGEPESIGYSVAHVDALKFIADTASHHKLPVVINVSQGQNLGAHDGTTSLEMAFDGITSSGTLPGIVIVKSAGNERTMGTHAEVQAHPGETSVIEWESIDVSRRHDWIELWFSAQDTLAFKLQTPEHGVACSVDSQKTEAKCLRENYSIHMTYKRHHPDNNDSQLALLIHQSEENGRIPPGRWRLEIVASEVHSDGQVMAWTEVSEKRPLRFTTGVSQDRTLTVPGTARTVVDVGACELGELPRLACFSSQGPTRDGRYKPVLTAPGVMVRAALAGTRGDGIKVMSGTSAAAPHVAGAVCLVLSRRSKIMQTCKGLTQFTARDIRQALSCNVSTPNPNWDKGLGFGRLNVRLLMQALVK